MLSAEHFDVEFFKVVRRKKLEPGSIWNAIQVLVGVSIAGGVFIFILRLCLCTFSSNDEKLAFFGHLKHALKIGVQAGAGFFIFFGLLWLVITTVAVLL